MQTMTNTGGVTRRRPNPMIVGFSILLLLLLVVGFGLITGVIKVADADCNTHYYAYDTPSSDFGPAVKSREMSEVLSELHKRRSCDPALVVAHREYADRALTSPEERDVKVQGLLGNSQAWTDNTAFLENREKTAINVIFREYVETPNVSMWMDDTRPRPTIIVGQSQLVTFTALVFIYQDGSEDVYKLDCGFQPILPPGGSPPGNPPSETPPGETPRKPPTPPEVQQNGDTGVGQEPHDNGTSGVETGPTEDSDGNVIAEPPVVVGSPGSDATGDAVDTNQGGTGNGEATSPFGP